MPRTSSRERIIDAAQAVVLKVGAAHMTLDAVAAEAGISKGGLIYNFPSKEALLAAMMERLIREFEAARLRARNGLPPGPAREIKAHVLSFLNAGRARRRLSAALLAAIAHDPNHVGPVRRAYRDNLARFTAEGIDRDLAAVIVLSMDGLFLIDLLGVAPFTARERRSIVERLLTLADEAAAALPRRPKSKPRRKK